MTANGLARAILVASALLISSVVIAQKSEDERFSMTYEDWKNQRSYLLPEFTQGLIYFVNRNAGQAKFNYNKILSNVQFIAEQKKPLTFANTQNISAVVVDGHEFIPVDGKFAEVIARGSDDEIFAVMWKVEIVDIRKAGAYGTVSSVAPAEAMTSMRMTAFGVDRMENIYSLQNSDEVVLANKNTYYIGKGYILHEMNKKNVMRIFPLIKDAIKEYINTNKVQFNSAIDTKALYNYCLLLEKESQYNQPQ